MTHASPTGAFGFNCTSAGGCGIGVVSDKRPCSRGASGSLGGAVVTTTCHRTCRVIADRYRSGELAPTAGAASQSKRRRSARSWYRRALNGIRWRPRAVTVAGGARCQLGSAARAADAAHMSPAAGRGRAASRPAPVAGQPTGSHAEAGSDPTAESRLPSSFL